MKNSYIPKRAFLDIDLKKQSDDFDFRCIFSDMLMLVANKLALLCVEKEFRKAIRFGVIQSKDDHRQLRNFRLQQYGGSIPYMLQELDMHGRDLYDAHSYCFGVWKNNQLIGSVRYTRWPFEVSEFIPSSDLLSVIPLEYRKKSLEISRLLIHKAPVIKGLLPGLILYSGLSICIYTPYTRYICYAKDKALRKFKGFSRPENHYAFNIHDRGCHSYLLLSGRFENEFVRVVNKIFYFKVGKLLAKLFFRKG